ncbi:RNA 3'-terminal phosphate cyclase [Candidatus Nitrosotenuis chungbukensis]|uniref:RNA 3'-terminal phosphate cyclase n=1 Tax=Candidatus Nitrosotenuis chungbukensis TaxID=1353246 RepID=UPI0005B25E51|nr:RNA 3'-terminal phosphate cyclase [Candidatus Nitrosotenuis chungbukensis]
MEILKIDGSHGESGGQILRSAVTLSSITGRPIQIENIRKNRKIPGLRAQHLSAVKLLAKLCNAKVEGLHIGSSTIAFHPNQLQDMSLQENVGTAGSISLILQVLIPAVALARRKLELSIIGGTDVLWSPTGDYTKHVLGEAFSRIGINFSMKIKKRGYYPKGGGIVDVLVHPSKKLNPIFLTKQNTKDAKVLCSHSGIYDVESFVDDVNNTLKKNGFSAQSQINEQPAQNQGASLVVFSQDSTSINGADELLDFKNKDIFGKKCQNSFLESNLGVDTNLSDMLVVPLSLINETSVFTVREISEHLQTNLYITSKITGCKYGVGKIDNGYEIRIQGNSDSSIQ